MTKNHNIDFSSYTGGKPSDKLLDEMLGVLFDDKSPFYAIDFFNDKERKAAESILTFLEADGNVEIKRFDYGNIESAKLTSSGLRLKYNGGYVGLKQKNEAERKSKSKEKIKSKWEKVGFEVLKIALGGVAGYLISKLS